ncbi:MAG: regulator [Vicinamibacteria bacterium]|nr:regulator [Vicinamibacteria bacterium]
MMRVIIKVSAAVLAVLTPVAAFAEATHASPRGLPYVYTKWKHFTIENGLPNNHVFAVRSNGNDLWVGTENGLALIDKRQSKVVKVWQEKDGLPFRSIAGIDVDKNTGDVWLGLFGGGLARLSGDRFDHWHQLNSGLVNDVVYDVVMEHENVWCATTAGASRFNPKTGEWAIFTEKNAPMEEIWNYAVDYDPQANKVFLAIWGSGVLEYDVATDRWQEYVDPDGEMEIDLYRDDGVNHVIVTGVTSIDGAMWVSSYFGGTRYDGRSWLGLPDIEGGLPSLFNNNVKGRSAHEAWFCSDKGAGAIVDLDPETWVQYVRDGRGGRAIVKQRLKPEDKTLTTVEVVETGVNAPHSFIVNADVEGNDVFLGTSHGLGWGVGEGYYPRLKERPLIGAAPKADVATQR